MALLLNNGQTPSGQSKPIPIDGSVFVNQTPLAANASVTTGWIPIGNYLSLLYIVQADQIGTVSAVEYSTDGISVNASGTSRAYSIPNRLLQVALTLKDVYFRLTFTNGPVAQNSFFFECKLSTSTFQNTMASAGQATTVTNLASLVKAIPESDDGTGTYAQIYRTGNALNVSVANFPLAFQVSNFPSSFQVSNFPTSQAVSGTVSVNNFPASFQVSNFPSAFQISNFPSSFQVSNFPATQAVTASALPLPAGAATETTLAATNTALGNLQTAINAINTDQGATTDAQATNSTGTWGELALLKGILQRPANSSVTSVTTLATSVLLLAANPNRKGASIFSVTGTILISLGSQNSATLFTARIVTNAAYEIPFGYVGAIYGIGAGTVTVTELT